MARRDWMWLGLVLLLLAVARGLNYCPHIPDHNTPPKVLTDIQFIGIQIDCRNDAKCIVRTAARKLEVDP